MNDLSCIFRTVRQYEDGVIYVASNSRIGRYCFFPKKIKKHYNKIPQKLIILDVGCGGAADHPLLYDYFDKLKIDLTLIGIDVNKELLDKVKIGNVTYPLEVDLVIESKGKLSFEEGMSSYNYRHQAYFPKNIENIFSKEKIEHSQKYHIDNGINIRGGRWTMGAKYLSRLNLIEADALNLPFPNNFADVIIAENFLFGDTQGISNRINNEINRVLKPEGLYLGDRRETYKSKAFY